MVSNKVMYFIFNIFMCVCILNNDTNNNFYKTRLNQNIMHKLKLQKKRKIKNQSKGVKPQKLKF